MSGVATNKISLILHGGTGRMGSAVVAMAGSSDGMTVRGVLRLRPHDSGEKTTVLGDFPVLNDLPAAVGRDEVVIDFSNREAIGPLVECLTGTGAPLVCGTTGLQTGERDLLEAYSKETPVFYDENMSYGISVMKQLLRVAAPLLEESSDVEIMEYHHRGKQDHPSGTAIALASTIDPHAGFSVGGTARNDKSDDSIRIHSVRAGGIPGEHHVLFAGDEEVLEVSHRALSRDVFARGALRAARFVIGKGKGLFSMEDLVRSEDA